MRPSADSTPRDAAPAAKWSSCPSDDLQSFLAADENVRERSCSHSHLVQEPPHHHSATEGLSLDPFQAAAAAPRGSRSGSSLLLVCVLPSAPRTAAGMGVSVELDELGNW